MNTSQETSYRILLIEENIGVSQTTAQLVAYYGHYVKEAPPQSMIALLEESTFDVLIVSSFQPDMHGLELIAQAKALQPQLATILCTEYTSNQAYAAHGWPDAVLTKPFGMDEVNTAIRQAIYRVQAA